MILAVDKVHIFWEGHKILRHLHCRFVFSTVEMLQKFIAFSEYMNIKKDINLESKWVIHSFSGQLCQQTKYHNFNSSDLDGYDSPLW